MTRRGASYALVLFLLLVFQILLFAMIRQHRDAGLYAGNLLHETQAFYLAQAAETRAVRDARKSPVLKDVRLPETGLGNGLYSYETRALPEAGGVQILLIRARGAAPAQGRLMRKKIIWSSVMFSKSSPSPRRVLWAVESY